MSFFAIIGPVLQLAVLIFTELFTNSKLARERKEKWDLDQANLDIAVQRAMEKFKLQMVKDNHADKAMQDRMDDELKKGG